jgi:hypothetical protein
LKLLEEGIKKHFKIIGMGSNHLGYYSKNKQMGLHQMKGFSASMKTTNRVKKHYRMGVDICKLFDRRLLSRIYKELKKLNTQRTNNRINKWANELNR